MIIILKIRYSKNDNVSCYYQILLLNNRFRLIELKFLSKLLHNHFDCPQIIQNLNSKINHFNPRNKSIFYFNCF